jgi:hypothetical protein
MKYLITNFLLILTLIYFIQGDSPGQERKKLAQTGLKFLSVSTDARVSAMGESATALYTGSTSMLYNPANMAWIDDLFDISIGTTKWIADIDYLHGTAALNLFDGDYGIIGLSIVAVDYGTFIKTVVAANEQGYLDLGFFSPTAIAFGVGYAIALSEKFSIGSNVKKVVQDLGSSVVDIDESGNLIYETNRVETWAFDFGILYKTGFKSLDFGMNIRNFSKELRYKKENFELPLTFRIGLSMNTMDLFNVDRSLHDLNLSVDASHPRDFAEQVFIGGEYIFMKMFALRAGINFPRDEGGFSAGFGVTQSVDGFSLIFDYAYNSFGIFNKTNQLFVGFDGIHRVTVTAKFHH